MVCLIAVGILLLVVMFVLSVLFRFGPADINRDLYDWCYRNHPPDAPRPVRHSPIAILPASSTLLLMVAVALCFDAGRDDLGGVLGLVWLATGIPLTIWIHHPPDWLKPAWLREEERRGGRDWWKRKPADR